MILSSSYIVDKYRSSLAAGITIEYELYSKDLMDPFAKYD